MVAAALPHFCILNYYHANHSLRPSPTGYLHLGHVVNAIYVWGWREPPAGACCCASRTDRIRSRDVFEHAILADLAWLGFVPDDGLHPVRRQSETTRRTCRARASAVHAPCVHMHLLAQGDWGDRYRNMPIAASAARRQAAAGRGHSRRTG